MAGEGKMAGNRKKAGKTEKKDRRGSCTGTTSMGAGTSGFAADHGRTK